MPSVLIDVGPTERAHVAMIADRDIAIASARTQLRIADHIVDDCRAERAGATLLRLIAPSPTAPVEVVVEMSSRPVEPSNWTLWTDAACAPRRVSPSNRCW